MTLNPKFHKYFIDVALRTAQLSSAIRLKVGAVAVRDRRIIACGYNGTGPGEDNCCEDILENGTLVTKPNVVHAEVNLIKFSKLHNIDLSACTLYITHSPCIPCAKEIEKAGIISIMYLQEYRDRSGIQYLIDTNILTKRFIE